VEALTNALIACLMGSGNLAHAATISAKSAIVAIVRDFKGNMAEETACKNCRRVSQGTSVFLQHLLGFRKLQTQ
jgi:hypothetical protein